MDIKRFIIRIAHLILEIKKSHDLLSMSWRTRKTSDISQYLQQEITITHLFHFYLIFPGFIKNDQFIQYLLQFYMSLFPSSLFTLLERRDSTVELWDSFTQNTEYQKDEIKTSFLVTYTQSRGEGDTPCCMGHMSGKQCEKPRAVRQTLQYQQDEVTFGFCWRMRVVMFVYF